MFDIQQSKPWANDEIRLDLIIPLVVVSLRFLLLLGVFAYLCAKQRQELRKRHRRQKYKSDDETKIPGRTNDRTEKSLSLGQHTSK